MPRRRPAHAGSWYSGDPERLRRELERWLEEPEEPAGGQRTRAIIAPHAGYSYSGPAAAYAYKALRAATATTKRVFILGPSHHMYTQSCVLSRASHYSTPFGDMAIDQGVYAELRATGAFEGMDLAVDEDEHSLEMHLPYVHHVMGGREFTIVPIMVGSLSYEREEEYGKLLARYIDDPDNVFVVSSDFCHWGQRFRYTFWDKSLGAIHQCIEALDRKGMRLIEEGDPAKFHQYLKEFKNTICGRHPIAVLLHVLRHCAARHSARFVRYEQSSRCTSLSDSSVSYASALITQAP